MIIAMHMRVRMIHLFMPMEMIVNFSQTQPDTVPVARWR
jgi:hypothetical protein